MDTQSIPSFNIGELIDYIICPAKCFITRNNEKKPVRETVKTRIVMALHSAILRSLDMMTIPDDICSDMNNRIFENLSYSTIASDIESVHTLFQNFNGMMREYELKIIGSVMPFEISYNGVILKSEIDMIVHDEKRGLKCPVVLDISKTRYEPFYNPIAYKCQAAAAHLDIIGTNTPVMVLGIATAKRWEFDTRKYNNLLTLSITESLEAMRQDMYPCRFGWWCAACSYRGLCHRLITA